MNEAAQKQETFGALEVTVNTETGEITTELPITTEILPRVARRLAANRAEAEHKKELFSTEISRLMALLDRSTTKHNEVENYLLAKCEHLMRESGDVKLYYPGIGKFCITMTKESVNSDDYDQMDDDGKAAVHKQLPGCFRLKTTVNPDKRSIRALIKTDQTVPGFCLNDPVEKFKFEEEK